MTAEPLPTSLRVASLLAWIWAIVMLVISVLVGIPAIAQRTGLQIVATAALLAVASAVAGHGIARRRRPWLALGASASWIVYLWLVPLRVSFPGMLVNAVILALVGWNVARFR